MFFHKFADNIVYIGMGKCQNEVLALGIEFVANAIGLTGACNS